MLIHRKETNRFEITCISPFINKIIKNDNIVMPNDKCREW